MPLSKSDRLQVVVLSFLGTGLFWGFANAKPAVAQLSGGTPAFLRLQAVTPGVAQTGHANVTGTVKAAGFEGNGSALTALDAGKITAGVLSDGLLSANVALLGKNNTFTAVNNFTNASNSFAGDGQLLVNLNASKLGSGFVPDARLKIGGDVNGTLASNTVDAIQGIPISGSPPTVGDVLEFTGSAYTPRPGGLTLPFSGTHSNPNGTSFRVTNNSAFNGMQVTSSLGTGIIGMSGTGSVGSKAGVSGTSSNNGGAGVEGIASGSLAVAGRFTGVLGRKVTLGGINEAVSTDGYYYREYEGGTTAAVAPIAYGCINSAGDIAGGTGNFTVEKSTTGVYDITIDGETYSNSNCAVSVTPVNSATARFATTTNLSGVLRVVMWAAGGTTVNNQFQFTVYRVTPSSGH